MDFPDDRTMHLLLSIATRQPITPQDGILTVELPRGKIIEDVVEELDALEEREWVVIEGKGDQSYPGVTDKGFYALELWIRRCYHKKLDVRQLVMTAAANRLRVH